MEAEVETGIAVNPGTRIVTEIETVSEGQSRPDGPGHAPESVEDGHALALARFGHHLQSK